MPHSRSASEVSQPESVISFNENIYLVMMNTYISTKTYVERARRIIGNLQSDDQRWIETSRSVNDVDASRVLDAMLTHARETGGDRSERFTACAICACPEVHEQVDLARTWFMYLLWPFTAGSHRDLDRISSEQATPTIDDTYGSLVSANSTRRGAFIDDVNRRDGYRCVVTGLWDGDHRPPGGQNRWVLLTGCHILKRAVGVFTIDRAQTAAATWNIIQHYTGMSNEMIQNMERFIDDPSNGIMLEPITHIVFDRLKIYFQRNPERENEYTLKEVGGGPWLDLEFVDKTITFTNHAAPDRELPLPSPYFLALHAGISRVLHMSGAAEVFEQIFDKYDGAAGGNAGVLKSGDPVHQLNSMMSAMYLQEGLPSIS